MTDSNQINIQAIYRKLGYFGCNLILVYLVPLVKVPKLNTQKSAIVNSNEPIQRAIMNYLRKMFGNKIVQTKSKQIEYDGLGALHMRFHLF